ncbi:MAG: hypothetical protein ABIU05_24860 [Nitrospirales bacterium]
MATILVIDDQETIRTLLRLTLEGVGHEVLEAANGRLGLALFQERSVDLVDMMIERNRLAREERVLASSPDPNVGLSCNTCLRDWKKLYPLQRTHRTMKNSHGSVS